MLGAIARPRWARVGAGMLDWFVWILFWLSAALIPLALLLHWEVPPFTRYDTVPAELGWAGVFGMAIIMLRFLVQAAPVLMIAFRPAAAGVPLLVWLALTIIAYVVAEVGLAFVYFLWMTRATDTSHGAADRAVWILGPLYMAMLVVESAAIFWLLRGGRDAA
jgi:hypothetical protein